VNTRTIGLKPKNITPKENQVQKEEAISPELLAMKNEFSQEDLANAFLAYAEQIKEDRPSIEAIVTASTPVKKDNFVVEFFIEHNAAKSQFDAIKSELLGFVKKRLGNYAIEIQEIINAEKTTKRIFSGKEKFEAMAEKNEALWRLRKELDLDIEF
jgi:DNA polymerase-3 subunit gamma/tau